MDFFRHNEFPIFSIDLSPSNSEEAALRLQNETDNFGNTIPHRDHFTGYDRQGNAALLVVNGSMPVPNRRFRSVAIQVTFTAHADRGQAESLARLYRSQGGRPSFWDPVVIALAPDKTSCYHQTPHTIATNKGVEISITAGFAPYVSIGPKYIWNQNDSGVERIDAMRIVGDKRFGEGSRSQANSVRWDVFENKETGSGVPSYLHNAVLLRRKPDDNGQFLGTVKIDADISWSHDIKEKVWRVIGSIPRDDPIVFDPQRKDRPGSYEQYRSRTDEIDLEKLFKIASIQDETISSEGMEEDMEHHI
ncbi:hypothetical protein V8C34DRAFT_322711 [Trichoderma compactum]